MRTSRRGDDLAIRERVAKGVRVLCREGLIRNAGHISVRPPDADWFWTPRHLHIGLESLGPGDIIACDLKGRVIDSPWEAPGERFIHTEMFAARPDVSAVCHFHPSIATVFSIAGKPLLPVLMQGAHLGSIPIYDRPEPVESPEQGRALAAALGKAPAVLMRGHGAVTVGQSVEEVCAAAVVLEETARMQLLASLLGKPQVIDLAGKEEIFRMAFAHFVDVFWSHHTQQPEGQAMLTGRLL